MVEQCQSRQSCQKVRLEKNRSGQPRADGGGVVVVPGQVAEHHRLAAREGQRLLCAARGAVHRDLPVLAAVGVVERDRVAHGPAPGFAEERRDEILHAAVPRIHLLLVVGAVEEGLVHAHLERPLADGLQGRDERVVARERRLHRRRETRLDERDGLDAERLVGRLEGEAHPAAAAPPRGGEAGALAAVGRVSVKRASPQRSAPGIQIQEASSTGCCGVMPVSPRRGRSGRKMRVVAVFMGRGGLSV